MLKFWYDSKKYECPTELEEEFGKIKREEQLKPFIVKNKLKVLKTVDPIEQTGTITKETQELIEFKDLVKKQSEMIEDLLKLQKSQEKK